MPVKKRVSIITVGQDKSEIKIYCLRRADGYTFRQCCWYEMGRRQVKAFTDLNAAKLFAQQKSVALANGLAGIATASHRDVEVLRTCEQRASRFGTTLPAAIEEWTAARDAIGSGSIMEAVRFYVLHHANLPRRTVSDLIPEFVEAKRVADYSKVHLSTIRYRLGHFEPQFGSLPIADVTTPQVEQFLRGLKVANVTRNGVRKSVVAFFSWLQAGIPDRGQAHGCRKIHDVRRSGQSPGHFHAGGNDEAVEICGSSDPARAGDWRFLRDSQRGDCPAALGRRALGSGFHRGQSPQGEDQSPAARANPAQSEIVAGPYREGSGAVCDFPCLSYRYEQLSQKAQVGWKVNALRHSYASYRLAQIQDAAKVALEMGNSPQMLFKHYRELVTPDAAGAWFGIVPERTA